MFACRRLTKWGQLLPRVALVQDGCIVLASKTSSCSPPKRRKPDATADGASDSSSATTSLTPTHSMAVGAIPGHVLVVLSDEDASSVGEIGILFLRVPVSDAAAIATPAECLAAASRSRLPLRRGADCDCLVLELVARDRPGGLAARTALVRLVSESHEHSGESIRVMQTAGALISLLCRRSTLMDSLKHRFTGSSSTKSQSASSQQALPKQISLPKSAVSAMSLAFVPKPPSVPLAVVATTMKLGGDADGGVKNAAAEQSAAAQSTSPRKPATLQLRRSNENDTTSKDSTAASPNPRRERVLNVVRALRRHKAFQLEAAVEERAREICVGAGFFGQIEDDVEGEAVEVMSMSLSSPRVQCQPRETEAEGEATHDDEHCQEGIDPAPIDWEVGAFEMSRPECSARLQQMLLSLLVFRICNDRVSQLFATEITAAQRKARTHFF